MSAINTKYTDKELLELYNLPLEELLNEAKKYNSDTVDLFPY